MNVNKMRRNMARNTPDEIRRRFDQMSDTYMYDYTEWVKRFGRRMSIKHNNQAHITVYVDKEIGHFYGDVLIIARHDPVELLQPWQRAQVQLRLHKDSLPRSFITDDRDWRDYWSQANPNYPHKARLSKE